MYVLAMAHASDADPLLWRCRRAAPTIQHAVNVGIGGPARGRVVVITQGADPTLVVENGVLHRYAVSPLAKQSIVDLNGAGDAFVGGFLSQLLLGKPIPDAVHAGHWAGRVIIQRSGCSVPEQCDYA